MSTIGDIRIRVTMNQRAEISRLALLSGMNLSTYMRERALSQDLEIHSMVKAIYEKLGLQNSYKTFKPSKSSLLKTRL